MDELLQAVRNLTEVVEGLKSDMETQRGSASAASYYSIQQVAKLTNLCVDTVRGAVVSGLLPASNLGTPQRAKYRISMEDVKEWMEKRKGKPAARPSVQIMSRHGRKKC